MKRTPLRPRSKKTAKVYRDERVPLTKRMLEVNPYCEVVDKIKAVKPDYNDCWRNAIGLHELKKRSAGGSITDPENLLRTCGPCNGWIEDNVTLAREAGLVIRSFE